MEYMASLNGIGVAARRHRITFLRESTGVELQGMVRLRDRERVQKKDRDKNRDPSMISQSKRRRLGKYTPRIMDKDVEGGGGGEDSSAEDSFDEDFEEFDGGKAPLSTYHRTITLASTVRSSPVLRGSDQMIGVPVPRRARSASVKRSHEYWNSGTGRFGEEQSRRRLAPSPLSRSINGFPTRKKMKRVEPITQIPKLASAEPSSSFQDDIEIEVAEALFELMKQSQSQSQSQSSKKFERSSDNNSTGKFDSICNKAVDDKSTCSPITSAKIAPQASDLPQEMNFNSGPLLDVGSKKNEDEDEDGKDGESLKVSACNVSSIGIKAHNNSLPKLEKMSSTDIASDALKYKVENKVGKAKDPKDQAGEVVTRVQVVAPKEEESRSCAKSNSDDSTNSSVSKASSRADSVENRREAKFEIDLMAPLPMPSSPERERDGLTEISYGHKFVSPDVQMKNKTMSKDESLVFGKGHEEKQMQTICNKQEFTRLDFEKPHKINFCSRQLGQNEQIQCQVPLSEGLDFAQTNLLPFPIAATGWPGGYHPGNMAPFQTITPSDGSAKPSAELQPVPFSLFQPHPKRATMHQHIARSIRYHQQLTKNCTWPVAFGSATLYGSNTYSFNPAIPSAPNSILGKPVEGVLPGQVLAGKSCEVSNNMDAAKTKQLVLQQTPQQTQPGNLPHGPTSIFPLVQNQAPGGPTRLPGPSKSAKAVGKVSLSNNSAGGHSVSSSSSPSGMGAVSFNCSNLPVNEAPPFTAILQNSEYPFSISTNGGIPPHMKGTEAPILPFFNASYYPSMFHFTQVQQQQSTSQPQPSCLHLVQLPPQAASTSSGSSSFHKRSHSQQQIGCQPSGRRSLSLAGMEQQQSQKQHVSAFPSSIKLDEEMSRRDSPIAVDSQESFAKRSSEGKSLAIPIHPMNVALMSHVALDSAGGNQHQYQQRKGSKCDMEVITPPAFAVSFGSAASSTQALNFSSVSQIPALFQMLPDLAKGGYQLVYAPQVVQHKNFEVSEEKSVVGAASNNNGMKGTFGKSVAQSLNFSKLGCSNTSDFTVNEIAADGSAPVLNVLPSAHTGSQPSGSSSTAPTSVFSVNTPNCRAQHQQLELIQFPKQHIKQMQMTGPAQVTAPTSTSVPYSFCGSNLPNSNNIASHNLVHNIHFAQLSLLKNAPLASTSPIPSLVDTSSFENLTQQHQRNSRLTQISFGNSSNSATAFRGQQIVINSQPPASTVDISPSNSSRSKSTHGNGSRETTSGGHKSRTAMAILPSQQTETSLNGPSPKSSPVCGRNVPSILSMCPSQLSELKH